MSSSRTKTASTAVQYAALPYRVNGRARPEVMLVTSRRGRRWIIPKGWPIKGLKPPKSAAREAYEEAGVRGTIGSKSIGSFIYEKGLEDGLTVGEVGSWAIHPGGMRVLSVAEEVLGLAPGEAWASGEVLREFGNMSSPTVLFILDRLRRSNAPRPCVAMGFGPGLTAEVALFR